MGKLSKSLADTIKSSKLEKAEGALLDLDIDYADHLLDEILSGKIGEGIIKEIPVIKVILTLSKGVAAIANYLLIKKIVKFLFQLKQIPVKERERFIQALDSKERREIIENLILVLDKHDNFYKSEIQGKLFKALIREKINQNEYKKLTYATNMINVGDINDLVKFSKAGRFYSTALELKYNFVFLQLVRVDQSKVGTWGGGNLEYEVNGLGKKFVEIIINP